MSLSKPIGAKLWLGSLATSISQVLGTDSGPSTPIDPEPINLAPDPIEFENWVNQPLSPMDSVYRNTFTNGGTGYLHYDIGAVAGEEYQIEIDQTRGAGTLLIYLAENADVTQANHVYGLEGGAESIILRASGPWLTFRASVGATTTTINDLRVYHADPYRERLDNGDFSNGVASWGMNGEGNLTEENGVGILVSDDGGYDSINQEIFTEVGKYYEYSAEFEFQGAIDGKLRVTAGEEIARKDLSIQAGTETLRFQATADVTNIQFFLDAALTSVKLFELSVKLSPDQTTEV